MIILSGVLVVVAIALLVTGIVTGNSGTEFLHLDGLKLIYISIAISIVSALCLAVGVVLRRKELFGSTAPKGATAKSQAKAERTAGKASKPVKAKARAGVTSDTATLPSSGVTADVPAETAVFVVPGRKRYHLETCRQLAGRDREELTFEEAREEGFTSCTACLPDTALAARAAVADYDAAHAEGAEPSTSLSEDETSPSAISPSALDESAWPDEPASQTRTDLPAVAPEAAEGKPGSVFDPPAKHRAGSVFDSGDETDAADVDSAAEDKPGSVFDSPAPSSGSLFEPVTRSGSVFDPPEETSATEDDQVEEHDEDEPAGAEDDTDAAPDVETTQNIEAVVADGAAVADTDTDEKTPADEKSEDEVVAETAAGTGESSVTAGEDKPGDEVEAAESTDEHEPVAAVPLTEEPLTEEPLTEDSAPPTDEKVDPDQAKVRILSGTKRYHRPDCALIEDIGEDADDLESLSKSAAKDRGCTPCLVCQPDKDSGADD